jgi:DNA-binding NtrC family response regulator
MSPKTSILVYGSDPQLLKTRRWILERADYRVSTAMELDDIVQLFSVEQVSLLILCHTLSTEECGRALALAHSKRPPIQTLALTAGQSGCRLGSSDEVIDAMEGPVKLLNTVTRLASSMPSFSSTQQNRL